MQMQLIHSTLKGRRVLAVPRLLPVHGQIQEFYPNHGAQRRMGYIYQSQGQNNQYQLRIWNWEAQGFNDFGRSDK